MDLFILRRDFNSQWSIDRAKPWKSGENVKQNVMQGKIMEFEYYQGKIGGNIQEFEIPENIREKIWVFFQN